MEELEGVIKLSRRAGLPFFIKNKSDFAMRHGNIAGIVGYLRDRKDVEIVPVRCGINLLGK